MNESGRAADPYRGKTALVTGGPGFIGSALCARLTILGARVHSVSRRADGPPGVEQHWTIDLAEEPEVSRLIKAVRPDFVFHLASHVMGAPDFKHVLPTFRGNLQSSFNLLYALTEVGCRRMITTGSLVEPDPGVPEKIPNSPYAAAKWATSDYARMFHALYGLPVAIARVFMVYGPGQQDESKLIPYTIRCVLDGRAPQITAGTHRIDWIYVDDVVRGLLALGSASNVDGKTADLGSGSDIATADIVTKVCDLMGAGVRPAFGAIPERPLEPKRVADVQATTDLIGWAPEVSLTDGLVRTIEWYRSHPANQGSKSP